MKTKKKKIAITIIISIMVIAAALFFSVENKSYKVHHSTIFSAANLTEIHLCIIMNSLLPVDTDELAKEVVCANVKLNGPRPNAVYELELYRTNTHYKLNWEYDTVLCDENGKIIEKDTAIQYN